MKQQSTSYMAYYHNGKFISPGMPGYDELRRKDRRMWRYLKGARYRDPKFLSKGQKSADQVFWKRLLDSHFKKKTG